jgi:hypothetical protein
MNDSGTTDIKNKRRKMLRGPSPIEYLLLGIIVIACVLLGTQDQELFLKVFYSKYSFLILVIMIFEFLVIKSSDRSKVYFNEMERLRECAGANLSIVREVDERLEQARTKIVELKEAKEAPRNAALDELHQQVTDALNHLRTRK